VGLGAVEVGEAVFAGEGPGAEDAAGPVHGAGIGGEGDDGAADVTGRFGHEEILRRVVLVGGVYVGVFALAGVVPVGFGDAEVVEDGFGAEEAGSERDRDDVAFAEFAGHGEGQADDGDFHEVVEKIAAVVEGVAIGDFKNNGAGFAAAAAFRFGAAEHQGNGEVGRDDVRVDGLFEHAEAVIEVGVPEGLAEFGEGVAAPDVVDEDVEAMVAAFDERDELFHLRGIGVIDANGNAAAAGRGDEFGGFFDGFGTAWIDAAFAGAAAGAINSGAGFAEGDGDAASSAAGGSGDQGDFAVERFSGGVLRHDGATFPGQMIAVGEGVTRIAKV